MRQVAIGFLLLSGIYADAAAEEPSSRVVDYLQAGWEIRAALEGPPRVLVLQKGAVALWCQMREYATPVTLKGVPQLLTASCATIR
jgi:hypothetical protein